MKNLLTISFALLLIVYSQVLPAQSAFSAFAHSGPFANYSKLSNKEKGWFWTGYSISTIAAATLAYNTFGGRRLFFLYEEFPLVKTQQALDRNRVRAEVPKLLDGFHWKASTRHNEDLFADEYNNTLQIKYKRKNRHRLRLVCPTDNDADPLRARSTYNLFAKAKHKYPKESTKIILGKVRDLLLSLDKEVAQLADKPIK